MPSFLGRFFAILLCRIGSIILLCSYSLKLTYFDKIILLLKSNSLAHLVGHVLIGPANSRSPQRLSALQAACLTLRWVFIGYFLYIPLFWSAVVVWFWFCGIQYQECVSFSNIGKQMTKMIRKTKPTERKWICRREWKTTRWRVKRSREDVEKSVKPKEETQLNF